MNAEQYTYVTIAAVLREQPGQSVIAAGGLIADFDNSRTAIFLLERTGSPWSRVLYKASGICHSDVFNLQRAGDAVELVVDTTEADSTVLEQLLDIDGLNILPVLLTNEREESSDGMCHHIPYRDVIGALQKAYQQRSIEVAQDLALAGELARMLENLTLRDAAEADPLVLATALVVLQCNRALPDGYDEEPRSASFNTYEAIE